MTPQEQIDKINSAIDGRIAGLGAAATEAEKRVYAKVQELVRKLKTDNGRIANTVENLRLIAQMAPEIEKAILEEGYQNEVAKFAGVFDDVARLNNNYFSSLAVTFQPKRILKEIRNQAVEWTVSALTESGISATFTPELDRILKKSLTTGGSYAEMTEEVRAYVLSDEVNEGAIARYARQVTTDAVNQYAATYNQAITQDLGLKWRWYTGSNIITTRPWCREMTKKRYVHEAELEDLISKEVDGVQICSKDIPCARNSSLPRGMIKGTNPTNIIINRGGWQCRHQWISVTETMIPVAVRIATYDKYGIQHNSGVAIPGAPRVVPAAPAAPDPAQAPAPAAPVRLGMADFRREYIQARGLMDAAQLDAMSDQDLFEYLHRTAEIAEANAFGQRRRRGMTLDRAVARIAAPAPAAPAPAPAPAAPAPTPAPTPGSPQARQDLRVFQSYGNDGSMEVKINVGSREVGRMALERIGGGAEYAIIDAFIEESERGKGYYQKTIINLLESNSGIKIQSVFRSPEADRVWARLYQKSQEPGSTFSIAKAESEETTIYTMSRREAPAAAPAPAPVAAPAPATQIPSTIGLSLTQVMNRYEVGAIDRQRLWDFVSNELMQGGMGQDEKAMMGFRPASTTDELIELLHTIQEEVMEGEADLLIIAEGEGILVPKGTPATKKGAAKKAPAKKAGLDSIEFETKTPYSKMKVEFGGVESAIEDANKFNNKEAVALLKKIKANPFIALKVSGIPEDREGLAEITMNVDNSGTLLTFVQYGLRDPDFAIDMQRTIDWKQLKISNEYFKLENKNKKAGDKGGGLGIKIFASQVKAAAEAGFSEINVHAAGNANSSWYNGYYTWARFGYKIPEKYTQGVVGRFNRENKTAYTFEQMFATKAGREFWKQHGDDWYGAFELKKGSYSQKTLAAYLQERGLGKMSAADLEAKRKAEAAAAAAEEAKRKAEEARRKMEEEAKKRKDLSEELKKRDYGKIYIVDNVNLSIEQQAANPKLQNINLLRLSLIDGGKNDAVVTVKHNLDDAGELETTTLVPDGGTGKVEAPADLLTIDYLNKNAVLDVLKINQKNAEDLAVKMKVAAGAAKEMGLQKIVVAGGVASQKSEDAYELLLMGFRPATEGSGQDEDLKKIFMDFNSQQRKTPGFEQVRSISAMLDSPQGRDFLRKNIMPDIELEFNLEVAGIDMTDRRNRDLDNYRKIRQEDIARRKAEAAAEKARKEAEKAKKAAEAAEAAEKARLAAEAGTLAEKMKALLAKKKVDGTLHQKDDLKKLLVEVKRQNEKLNNNDTTLQKIAATQKGMAGLPAAAVSEAEMDELLKNTEDFMELRRGVYPELSNLSAQKMLDTFVEGEMYQGRGIYGNGTYFDYDKEDQFGTAVEYGDNKPENVWRAAISTSAKIIDSNALQKIAIDFQSLVIMDKDLRTPERMAAVLKAQVDRGVSKQDRDRFIEIVDLAIQEKERGGGFDSVNLSSNMEEGAIATLLGYDAIRRAGSERYLVVLNRTALIVQKTTAENKYKGWIRRPLR